MKFPCGFRAVFKAALAFAVVFFCSARAHANLTLFSSTTFNDAGSGTDFGRDIVVDSTGNVFIFGVTEPKGGTQNGWLGKYNSSGVFIASTSIGTMFPVETSGRLAMDKETGRLFVVGFATQTAGQGSNIFLATFGSDLTPLGTKEINGKDGLNDEGVNVAVDSDGDAWVVGTVGTTSNGKDLWIAEFSETLVLKGSTTVDGGGGDDEAGAITIDSDGNIYVAASIYSGSGAVPRDSWVGRFDSNLTLTHSRQLNLANNAEDMSAIEVAPNGKIYVVGSIGPTGTVPPDDDGWIGRYSATLTFEASTTFKGSPDFSDHLFDMTVGPLGDIWVVGTKGFVADVLTTGEVYFGQYNPNLALISSTTFGIFNRNDFAFGVDFDPNFEIWMTGFVGANQFNNNGDLWLARYEVETGVFGFEGRALDFSRIEWRWNQVPSATSYALVPTTGGVVAAGLSAGTTFFIETNLSTDTARQRKLLAYRPSGLALSPDVTTYTFADDPGAPVFDGVFTTSFTLSWDRETNPASTRFEVQISTDNFATAVTTAVALSEGLTGSATTIEGLLDVTTYYAKVRAYNGDDIATAFTAVISSVTAPFPPRDPVVLNLPQSVGISTTAIRWEWSHFSPPIFDGFEVIASTGGPVSGPLGTTATSYVQEGLAPNTTFAVRVKAFNRGGTGLSAAATRYTLAERPSNLAAIDNRVFITSVAVQWDPGSNPGNTRYELTYSGDNFTFDLSTAVALADGFTGTSTTITGLIAEATYFFRVRAYNGDGSATEYSVVGSTLTRPQIPNVATISGLPDSVGLSTDSIRWRWGHVQPPGTVGFTVLASTGGPISGVLSAPVREFIQSGLTPNASFAARVEAFNITGQSLSAAATRYSLARPPITLAVTEGEVHVTSLAFTWGTNGNPAYTRYEFQASTDSFVTNLSTPTPLSAGLTGNSTFVLGLEGGATYQFRIRAYNQDDRETAFSVAVSTIMRPPLPLAPTIRAFPDSTGISTSAILWQWDHVQPPFTNDFRVAAATGGLVSGILESSTRAFVQEGLTPNTTFTVSVVAFNVSGSSPSGVQTRYTHALPPGAPFFNDGDVQITSATLSWAVNGNPAGTRFEVSLSTDAFATDFSTPVPLSAGLTASSTDILGLVGETTYTFRIRAFNGDGIETAFSTTVSTRTRPPKPNAPVPLGLNDSIGLSTDSIRFRWTQAVPPSIQGYRVFASTGGALSSEIPFGTEAFVLSGLTTNTTFAVRIEAFNVSNSSLSQSATRYTLADVPFGSDVPVLFLSSASLTWNANGNPSGTVYEVHRSTNNVDFGLITTTTSTAIIDHFTIEATYFYKVRALNGDGIVTAFDAVTSTNVFGFSPIPPRGFKASVNQDRSVLLTWLPSPSRFVEGYDIYWDSATGTVDYSTTIASVVESSRTYTTSVLDPGTYYFGIRARSILADDRNTTVVASVVVATTPPFARWVQSRLRAPQIGKSVYGNRVTLEARLIQGRQRDLRGIRFDYRAAGSTTAAWVQVPAVRFNNPDPRAPYFVQWNVTGLPEGAYEVRAVAENRDGRDDPWPPTQFMRTQTSGADIVSNLSGQSILYSERVFTQFMNEVAFGDEDGERLVRITLGDGFQGDRSPATLKVETLPASVGRVPRRFSRTGVELQLSLENGPSKLGAPVDITTNYRDDDEDGILDGTLARIDRLKFFFLDPSRGWLSTVPTEINRSERTARMLTDHFSTFALFSAAASTLDNLRVYPVPWIPNDGVDDNGKAFQSVDPDSGIIFDNLTQTTRVEIYTVSGELVWEKTIDDSSGKIQWDGMNSKGLDAASGAYLAVIIDTNSGQRLVRKIAIIR